MTDPLFTPLKSHPSTWEAEAKALRARVAKLESENKSLREHMPAGWLDYHDAQQARAALQEGGAEEATTQPHSAKSPSRKD